MSEFTLFVWSKTIEMMPSWIVTAGRSIPSWKTLCDVGVMELETFTLFIVLLGFIGAISRLRSSLGVVKILLSFAAVLFAIHCHFLLVSSKVLFETNKKFYEEHCTRPSHYDSIARDCSDARRISSLGVSGNAFNASITSLENLFMIVFGGILTPLFIQVCIGLSIVVFGWAVYKIRSDYNKDMAFVKQSEQAFDYQKNIFEAIKLFSSNKQTKDRKLISASPASSSRKRRSLIEHNGVTGNGSRKIVEITHDDEEVFEVVEQSDKQ